MIGESSTVFFSSEGKGSQCDSKPERSLLTLTLMKGLGGQEKENA